MEYLTDLESALDDAMEPKTQEFMVNLRLVVSARAEGDDFYTNGDDIYTILDKLNDALEAFGINAEIASFYPKADDSDES